MIFILYHLSRSTKKRLSLKVEFPSKYDDFKPLVLLREAWLYDNRNERKSDHHIAAFRKFERYLFESDLDLSQTRIKQLALGFIDFLKREVTDLGKQEREVYKVYCELFRPIKFLSDLSTKRSEFELEEIVEFKRLYQDIQDCRPQKFRPKKTSNELLKKVDQLGVEYEDCLDGIRLYSFYVLEKFDEFRRVVKNIDPQFLKEIISAIQVYPEASKKFLSSYGEINGQKINGGKAIKLGFKSISHLRVFYRRLWAKFFKLIDNANVVLIKELMVLQLSSSIDDASHFPSTVREFPSLKYRVSGRIQRGNKKTSRSTKYFANSLLGKFSSVNSSSVQSALLNAHLKSPLSTPIPTSEYLQAVRDFCTSEDQLVFGRVKVSKGVLKHSRVSGLSQLNPLHLVSSSYLERAALYWYLSSETIKGETLRAIRLNSYFETKNAINFQEYKARASRPFSQGPWHSSTPNYKALKRFQEITKTAVDIGLLGPNPFLFSVPDPFNLEGKVPSRAQGLYFPRTGRFTLGVTGNAPCILFPSFENSLAGENFKSWLKLQYSNKDLSLVEKAWAGFRALASIELRNAAEMYVRSTVTGKSLSERRAYLISSNLSEMKVAASQPRDPHDSMMDSELTRMLRAHSNSHSPKVEIRDYIQHKSNARFIRNNAQAQEIINNEFLLSAYALNGKETKLYTLKTLRADLGLAPAVELDKASIDILKHTFGRAQCDGYVLDESGILKKDNQMIFIDHPFTYHMINSYIAHIDQSTAEVILDSEERTIEVMAKRAMLWLKLKEFSAESEMQSKQFSKVRIPFAPILI